MDRNEDRDPPAPSPNVPAARRSFSTHELEAVIRRAVELQAGSPGRADEAISDAEVVRIGQELGLEPAVVRRAMAEVSVRAPEERGVLAGTVGPRTVRASRVIPFSAARAAAQLDRYLRDVEFMVPQRRFPDRTRYIRDSSLAAGFGRFARTFTRSLQPLKFGQLDAAISALDAESCLVEVSVDLGGTRAGLAGGVLGSSTGVSAAWAATAWATAIPDPLMLLAVPVLAGAWFGTRAIYASIAGTTRDKLESLLDRLE